MRELTGFTLQSKQLEQLRRMGIAFFVNGRGMPIVTVSAIEGRKQQDPQKVAWIPSVLLQAGVRSSNTGVAGIVQKPNDKIKKTKCDVKTPRP